MVQQVEYAQDKIDGCSSAPPRCGSWLQHVPASLSTRTSWLSMACLSRAPTLYCWSHIVGQFVDVILRC